jgi:hypothetical protein
MSQKQQKANAPKFIVGDRIWDMSRVKDHDKMRMELTDLIRFKGCWYCGFREGFMHGAHPSGRGRVIRSADGKKWESVFLKEWDCASMGEPKLSITAEGMLMINTSIYFVSRETRPDGHHKAFDVYDRPLQNGGRYGRYYQLENPGTPENDRELNAARQSVTWLSEDGVHWSSAYACPTGVNAWRWEVCWHNGMGYSVGYCGKDKKGTLYRTRDGKSWRVLLNNFFPGGGNEAALAFGADSTAYCLLRGARLRKISAAMKKTMKDIDGHQIGTDMSRGYHGSNVPMLGIGKAPYYQEWEWKDLRVDWNGDGNFKTTDEVLRSDFGGPKITRLRDGRFVATARNLGPGRDDGHITLFWLDPAKARLTMFAECAGATYGAAIEHEGKLWVSYAGKDKPGLLSVFLAKTKIPA